jgi:23S rRNA pseudouridine1911/1915/1917 synthase
MQKAMPHSVRSTEKLTVQEFQERDGDTTYVTTHLVDEAHNGWRVDLFVKEKLKRKSRAFIQKAIEDGSVVILPRSQGQTPRLKPSTPLQVGDYIQIVTERNRMRPEPEVDFNYGTHMEDEHILVIEKPANLPVHPAGRFFFNTLLTHLRTERKAAFESGMDFHIVHRIDRETSGIMVLAKSSLAAANLVAQFREHRVKKKYLAIVHGETTFDEIVVDAPMDKDPHAQIRLKMAVVPGGQVATTRFVTLKRHNGFSLLEAYPLTGRQHQIRVHAESLGHPLVGDKIYGRKESTFLDYLKHGIITDDMKRQLILDRHALHACFLRFSHPVTDETITVESALPHDLKALIDGHSSRVQRGPLAFLQRSGLHAEL